MSIIIDPCDSLVHEHVHIWIRDLEPNTIYRVELRLLHPIGIYRSFGVFKTNAIGVIDLSKDSPIRGTYAGVRRMGLFESVEPTDTIRQGAYCKCTPPDDFNYELRVTSSDGVLRCSKTLKKRLLHPNVERIEIDHLVSDTEVINSRKVVGTLFKPFGDGPFPAVIDISGTGGGINEQKGAALSSRGFCVLSLAFFQYKNLPEVMQKVDVQYFEDAIDFMRSLPFTTDKIGFQGVSFGGTLAIYLSTLIPTIKAVVSINGSYSMDNISYITVHGEMPKVAVFPQDGKNLYFLNSLMCYDKMVRNLEYNSDARFKLENSSPETVYRFVSSLDDLSTPTIYATNLLTAKLKKLKRDYEVHFLPGGHLMDPPCYPAHPTVFAKFAGMHQAYGGDFALHGKSQFEAWEATVAFFKKHLSSDGSSFTTTSKI
ncbi:unnamed protein product [Caenorhabditis bovis]|uniref:BAAT/Acyl-CoA thioester hydrolase C-terminal domain-containing protein n=1 Tax=Caenorhabditis bovis TaxID=2654633 RepID=A0A8S1EF66_9PELO|nr:unnamed protein product [Caenorhabditis bovis]